MLDQERCDYGDDDGDGRLYNDAGDGERDGGAVGLYIEDPSTVGGR